MCVVRRPLWMQCVIVSRLYLQIVRSATVQGFGYDHFSIGLSICVQKMVRSDLGSSGVAFSLDTESGFKDVVVINGAFGLGEMVVQGSISPDEFIVFKPTLQQGYNAIIEKKLGVKDKMMVYGDKADDRVKLFLRKLNFKAGFVYRMRWCCSFPPGS